MNTRRMLLALLAGMAMPFVQAQQQFWNSLPGGNVITNNEWFGADLLSTIPLSFETRVNQPMLWSTNNVNRMRLIGTNTTGAINGYTGLDLSGFLGLGPFGSTLVDQPFAALHIDNNGIQESAYRPWMRTGMLLTQGSDQGYFGLKDEGLGRNHSVIAWSDNTLNDPGPDNLRFIFTSNNTAAYGTAGQLDGLEAARFVPSATGNQTFFGVGDWFTAGIMPRERVDVLDGRLRIRQLPNDLAANGPFRVMVVDDTPAPSAERGVVKWVDPSIFGGGVNDCDWIVQTPDPHVSSVYDGSNCPWDRTHGAGIGMQFPRAKLHVFHNDYTLLGRTATWSRVVADDMISIFQGVLGESGPDPMDQYVGHVEGVHGFAYNGKVTIGVRGHGLFDNTVQGSAAGHLVGVQGEAEATNSQQISFMAGLYGTVIAPPGTPNAWAAFINGPAFITQPWTISDENLKTDIEDAAPVDAASALNALSLHTYTFNHAAAPTMVLPLGEHLGLLAPELEQVLPDLVMDAMHPAEYDSLGNVTAEAVPFKAVNMQGLIPYLIGGHQDQNATMEQMQQQIAAQNDAIAQMQELLAACCAHPASDERMHLQNGGLILGKDRDLIIQPNPFSEPPTVFYSLERAGRMQLMANSADGKQLVVLRDATQEAGESQLVWDTNALQPGMYYLTLLLDSEPVVKKAVKVGR
ncbi:MAG: tail fiber domain-containing protein [Flavobacteriales bacterium]|nr:tail fiber domain-containing protein [Flavobacteriales bacterium]